MKLVDEHSFIFTLRSARVKEDKNGAGFITLLLDVLLVVGLILFLIIELLKNKEILISFIQALKGGF